MLLLTHLLTSNMDNATPWGKHRGRISPSQVGNACPFCCTCFVDNLRFRACESYHLDSSLASASSAKSLPTQSAWRACEGHTNSESYFLEPISKS